MTFGQWVAAAFLLGGIVLSAWMLNQRDLEARANVLRPLFALPDGAVFSEIRSVTKSARTAPKADAVVRLSAADLEAYAEKLDQPLWGREPPSFGDAPLLPLATENIRWRNLPAPASVGASGVTWSSLSAGAVSRIRNGRVLCIALQERHAQAIEAARRYTARDCSDVRRTEQGLTILLGAIDLETSMLHLTLR